MSSLSRKEPALRSSRRPETVARSSKKNPLAITPRSSSTSAIWPSPAPRGIWTWTAPSPSPLNGWNSDSAR